MIYWQRKLFFHSPHLRNTCDSCASLTVKINKHSHSSYPSSYVNSKAPLKRYFNLTPIKVPKKKCLELPPRIKHFSSTPKKVKPSVHTCKMFVYVFLRWGEWKNILLESYWILPDKQLGTENINRSEAINPSTGLLTSKI